MKYIEITNKEELPIELIELMGETTKSDQSDKIGQWGSGLKYAISFMLRNNIEMVITTGTKRVDISVREESIKGAEFGIIYIAGQRTSLTTQMGGDAWSEWQCIREIWSNALDEGGAERRITNELNPEKGTTKFYIEATPKMLSVWNDWSKYFINDKEPFYENEDFKLYPSGGNLRLYKQGVLIGEREAESVFIYDFKKAEINELREYRGTFHNDLSDIIYKIDDPEVIRYFISNITDDHYESGIDYKWWRDRSYDKPNNAWRETIGNAKIIHKKAADKIKAKNVNVDLSGTIELPKNLYDGLNVHFKDISALRIADKCNEFYEIYDDKLDTKLKAALEILEQCGYFMHPELKYIFGEFGRGNVMARVNMDTKEVWISERMKDKPMFNFVSMLVEENEHLRTEMEDETREFQQHFIDLYTQELLAKAGIEV